MDAAGFDRASLIIRSDLAIGGAHAAVHVNSAEAGVVDAIDALRLAVLAAALPEDRVEEADPGRWMRVELFGHQVVYGLAAEVFWAGRRWLDVSWPAYTVGSTESPAGSKRYHPNAVYATEEIGEKAVMENLTSYPF